jgi:predicted transcriptional regulator
MSNSNEDFNDVYDAVLKLKPAQTEKLIRLRAENLSLSNIAKELHIAKDTVVKAVKYYEQEINEEMYNIAEELREKYKVTKQRKLESYMSQLEKMYDELESRDYKEVKTKDLIQMIQHIEEKIKEETKYLNIGTGIMKDNDLDIFKIPEKTEIRVGF